MRHLKTAIALACLTSLAGCSSEYDSSEIKTKDRSLHYTSEFLEKESGDPITGTVVFKRDETVVKSIQVVDGKVTGEWIDYSNDGKLLRTATLENGVEVGVKTQYCEDELSGQIRWTHDYSGDTIKQTTFDCKTGLLTEESTKLKGVGFIGVSKAWHIVDGNQVPKSVENYNAVGKKDGVSEIYFKDGQLHSSQTFKDGKQTGVAEEFFEDGKMYFSRTYIDGKQDGPYKEYVRYEDGTVRLKEEGIYKGYSMVEGKTYETDTRYPEGTLEKHIFPIWDGGHATLFFGPDKVGVNWTEGEASTKERMVMTKVLDGQDALQSDIDNIAYLIKTTQVDLNKVYGEGRYVMQYGDHLITAMAEGYYDPMISMGLDPQSTDFDGTTRLMMCIQNERRCSFDHMMRLANDTLAAGAKSKHAYGETAASFFCKNLDRIRSDKKYDLFTVLLKLDDVNKANFTGQTPLHQCMGQKDLTAAKMLIAAGADLTAKNYGGFTPLDMGFVQQHGFNVQLKWSPDRVKAVGEMAKGSSFSFNAPVPVYKKSLKDIFLENGDAASAQATEAFN